MPKRSRTSRKTTTLRRKLKSRSKPSYAPRVVSASRRTSGAIGKFTTKPGTIETKTLDVLFTGAAAAAYTVDTVPLQTINVSSNTTCVQAVNLVQQGPGTSQRIGHKISMKSLRLRMSILPTGNVNASPTNGRVLLVYDHNPDGAYIATNQILANITQANVVQNGIFTDNLNPNFFDRMSVLMDEFITLPPFETGAITSTNTTGVTQESAFHIDRFISLKNLEVVFGNTTNGMATANPMTIAYVQTGALYIVGYGDTAAGAAPWVLTGSARLRFRDN